MNWNEIIAGLNNILPGLLTGGGLVAFINYLKDRRSSRKDDFETIVQQWKDDNSRLRAEATENEKNLIQLRSELEQLKSKFLLLESSNFELPLPMWLKDTKGEMLMCNKHFEELLLLPNNKTIADVIGLKDKEIWEGIPDTGINDFRVLQVTTPVYLIEEYPIMGNLTKFQVIKYARYVGNVKIGIAGIIIPQRWN